MPTVTLSLGLPTGSSAGNWVQWDDRINGYGDLSVFSEPSGEQRALIRLRLFRNGQVQFQVIDVPDGSSGFGSREDLSAAWTQYSAAIVARAAGVTPDLTITGPNSPDSSSQDTTEPYGWTNGNDTEHETWFDAYEAAGRPALAIDVDDGVAALMSDVAEAAALAEALASQVSRGDGESARLSEAHRRSINAGRSEAVSIAEEFASVIALQRFESESISIAEDSNPRLALTRASAESIGIADALTSRISLRTRDAESLKIRPWGQTGIRQPPEMDVPPIDRDEGYTIEYASPGGGLVTLETMNQIFREITGMCHELNTRGSIPVWDERLDYVRRAFCMFGGDLYVSAVATGPSTENAEKPGTGAVWRLY